MSDFRKLVWDKFYSGMKQTYDVFGNPMSFSNFEIDHIYPISLNGSNCIENLIPLSPISNAKKSCYIQGKINSRNFKVKKTWINNLIVGQLYINDVLVLKILN